MKHTIVVDLDGTLANVDHRVHLIRSTNPDWDAFYSNCDKDLLNAWCAELMRTFSECDYSVIIVSARRLAEKEKTLKWLETNKVKFSNLLLLREDNDHSPDTLLKKKWLDGYGKDRILFIVDDRQKVVDMWRSEGLVCLQCYSWEEFK